jgi:hypothetical protein
MKNGNKPDIGAIFRDGTLIDEAVEEAAEAAYRLHARMGQPIVACEHGRVVLIPARAALAALRRRRQARSRASKQP